MCGIAGFIDYQKLLDGEGLREIATRQSDSIGHRGPDSGDTFVDPSRGVSLSHRRLAIIDLSPMGYQPMQSADGNCVIVYNGEIYNADEIRPELEQLGIRFRGHSDTEVLLEACAAWGVSKALPRFIGMFAFALLNRSRNVLTIARDRLGIKPLYYGFHQDHFIFGSELKALRAHPACPSAIDYDSVSAYLRYQYVPAPHSIYENIKKLIPGTFLDVRIDRMDGNARPTTYWSFEKIATSGYRNKTESDPNTRVQELDTLLSDAVKRRMIADVPLGVFLSGGIDSSTVVALMQEQSAVPVKSFSIGFDDESYDEAVYARDVAKHLGTDHTELYVSPEQARNVIPNLVDMYDEPFADSSQIPTYLVSAMTRKHVTVALSGDGGDELFGGYNRYNIALADYEKLRRYPHSMRKLFSKTCALVPIAYWDKVFAMLPHQHRPMHPGHKVHNFAKALAQDFDGRYARLISAWDSPNDVSRFGEEHATVLFDKQSSRRFSNLLERMQYWDTLTYLPDDILTKVDRASMAVSLEVRVPIIDHRVVEYAWTLPQDLKIRDGLNKWILRQVLYKRVPNSLIDRPKRGFAVPLDAWFRGPLKEWAGDLLSADTMSRFGLLYHQPIERVWKEHMSGSRDWSSLIWNITMLQSWCDKNLAV